MRLSVSKWAVLSALFPLPLLSALVVAELSEYSSLMGRDPLLTTAALSACVAYIVAAVRVGGAQFRLATGSAGWLLVPIGGTGLYLLGSFLGEFLLHWLALPVVYAGLLAYLGGRRFAYLMLPALAAFALISFPAFAGASLSSAAAAVLIAMTALSVLPVVRARRLGRADCRYCRTYRESGEQFCLFCGLRLVGKVRVNLPARRLLAVALATAFLVFAAFGASIPIASLSGTGILVIDHRLTGVTGVTLVPSFRGWSTEKTSSNTNDTLTAMSYAISGKGKVNASMVLSQSAKVGTRELLAQAAGAAGGGTALLGTGQVAVYYSWSSGNLNYSGIEFGLPLTYLSSGAVKQSYAAFLFSLPASANGQSRSLLYSFANSTAAELAPARQTNVPMTAIVGPIVSNQDYAALFASFSFLGVVAGAVRNVDSTWARLSDGSLSLDREDFEMLASLGGRTRTGEETVAVLHPQGGWEGLGPRLARLEGLGLVEKRVVERRLNPTLLWTARAKP